MGPMDEFDTKNIKLAKDFQLARKLAFGKTGFGVIELPRRFLN